MSQGLSPVHGIRALVPKASPSRKPEHASLLPIFTCLPMGKLRLLGLERKYREKRAWLLNMKHAGG